MSPFEREDRYIVFKKAHLTPSQLSALEALANMDVSIPPVSRQDDRWPTVECVVVEHDWPEYETVWRMIEDRVGPDTQADIVWALEIIQQHIDDVEGDGELEAGARAAYVTVARLGRLFRKAIKSWK